MQTRFWRPFSFLSLSPLLSKLSSSVGLTTTTLNETFKKFKLRSFRLYRYLIQRLNPWSLWKTQHFLFKVSWITKLCLHLTRFQDEFKVVYRDAKLKPCCVCFSTLFNAIKIAASVKNLLVINGRCLQLKAVTNKPFVQCLLWAQHCVGHCGR